MVTRSRANGRSCGVEACRKSPQPASPVIHRASPYKKDNIRKLSLTSKSSSHMSIPHAFTGSHLAAVKKMHRIASKANPKD
ncbi:hypothetical protein B296_00002778 [Ensete ventricosum]|uniref:Uncharacterized protein n=1 Tax=Ensete ventricosum TaxID=4639 RepID=A0A427A8M5_ENSVE|nr:hypothetical protein B296_00002778 [Ensete ventricosum]